MAKPPRRMKQTLVNPENGAPAIFKVKGVSMRKFKKYLKATLREHSVELAFKKGKVDENS